MREVISKHKVDQTTFQWLRKEKVIVDTESKDLKVEYALLKDNKQGIVL